MAMGKVNWKPVEAKADAFDVNVKGVYLALYAAQEAGIKTILATCPHCFNTLSDEYPQFGGHYRVMHHTQFLAELDRTMN